jgi:heptosyltransferase-2
MTVDLSRINKILIIRLSSLGDILLATPLIRNIKKKYPLIQIDFILKDEYSDLLKNNPHINKILPYSKGTTNHLINHSINQSSNHSGYDLIVDLQNNLRSRKITSKLKARTVRFKKYSLRKFLLVKTKINLMKNLPSIPERYAETIGVQLDESGVEIISNKKPSDKIVGLKNLVGICPGAKHFTKRYPIEYQIQLSKLLVENNFNVVLFGGRIDKEICNEISVAVPQVINLQNEDDILQTVSDMQLCDTIVCNDSGLMHVASSLNKKLIAIFGSTVREFGFMPYNCKNSIVVENEKLSCRPCSHIGRAACPKSHFNCMREIKPEKIFQIIKSSDA